MTDATAELPAHQGDANDSEKLDGVAWKPTRAGAAGRGSPVATGLGAGSHLREDE